jgi:secreted Zn-dependent insulinase-like peptidase
MYLHFVLTPQAGALEREVQAVDSEFSGVLQSDHSRLAQLMCHTVRTPPPLCVRCRCVDIHMHRCTCA